MDETPTPTRLFQRLAAFGLMSLLALTFVPSSEANLVSPDAVRDCLKPPCTTQEIMAICDGIGKDLMWGAEYGQDMAGRALHMAEDQLPDIHLLDMPRGFDTGKPGGVDIGDVTFGAKC